MKDTSGMSQIKAVTSCSTHKIDQQETDEFEDFPQLLDKGCQYRKEDFKIRLCKLCRLCKKECITK